MNPDVLEEYLEELSGVKECGVIISEFPTTKRIFRTVAKLVEFDITGAAALHISSSKGGWG